MASEKIRFGLSAIYYAVVVIFDLVFKGISVVRAIQSGLGIVLGGFDHLKGLGLIPQIGSFVFDLHAAVMLIDLDGGIKLHHILIVDDFIYREEILIAEHDDHMLS